MNTDTGRPDLDAADRVVMAEDEWFTRLRLYSPLLGKRKRGSWAMQPFGPKAKWVMATLTSLTILAIAAATAGLTPTVLAVLVGATAAGFGVWLVLTFPWSKSRIERAMWVGRGEFVRVPGKLWEMDCVSYHERTPLRTIEFEFVSGRTLTVDEERELLVVIPGHGRLTMAWMFGREHRDRYLPRLKRGEAALKELAGEIRKEEQRARSARR